MQDSKNHRGSILLYVIFLSAFLILFFAQFQGEVEKTLNRADSFENTTKESSVMDDSLSALRGHPTAYRGVGNSLDLVSMDYDGSSFSGSLGNTGTAEYWITNSTGTLTLTVSSSGAPVLYRLAAFNSGSESSAVIYASGVINTSASIPLSNTADHHLLYLESLGGYTSYSVAVGTDSAMPATSLYRLERDTNGYTESEGEFEVVNFLPKSYPGIDYAGLGMYLKN